MKRDRLAHVVTKFADYVSKGRGPPRPSGKEIYRGCLDGWWEWEWYGNGGYGKG